MKPKCRHKRRAYDNDTTDNRNFACAIDALRMRESWTENTRTCRLQLKIAWHPHHARMVQWVSLPALWSIPPKQAFSGLQVFANFRSPERILWEEED